MLALSGVLASGNENGAHQPDGRYYLGSGKTAGYAIFNLGGSYKPSPQVEIIAQINNLFDRQYASAARLSPTGFDANGNFIARPFPAVDGQFATQQATFYAPGAPRLFWLGLRYTFDQPAR